MSKDASEFLSGKGFPCERRESSSEGGLSNPKGLSLRRRDRGKGASLARDPLPSGCYAILRREEREGLACSLRDATQRGGANLWRPSDPGGLRSLRTPKGRETEICQRGRRGSLLEIPQSGTRREERFPSGSDYLCGISRTLRKAKLPAQKGSDPPFAEREILRATGA